jgi:hypothetical protein
MRRKQRLSAMNTEPLDSSARRFCDFLEDIARDTLAPVNNKVLSAEDRNRLEYALTILRKAFEGCVERLNEPIPKERLRQMPFACGPDGLNQAMAAAFIIGSLSGETETAKNYFGEKHGAPGGYKTGERKRQEAESGWKSAGLPFALKLRADDQSLSQVRLAEKMAVEWDLDQQRTKFHCPESELISAIRAWEQSGRLPKMKRIPNRG